MRRVSTSAKLFVLSRPTTDDRSFCIFFYPTTHLIIPPNRPWVDHFLVVSYVSYHHIVSYRIVSSKNLSTSETTQTVRFLLWLQETKQESHQKESCSDYHRVMESRANIRAAKLYIAHSKDVIAASLYPLIHKAFQSALVESPSFYIALSGGSLPSLLSDLPLSFHTAGIDPQWEKWHVLLADERLVTSSDPDSNLKALKESFLDHVPIPLSQIYGIEESLLKTDNGISCRHEVVAQEYQNRVFSEPIGNGRRYFIDCVLLGFGPDGHTASLFPNHKLLCEYDLLVAGIKDSPKLPLERITLTLKVFNEMSRNVIFVGAGESKAPILRDIFERVHLVSEEVTKTKSCVVEVKDLKHQKYPCGMIRPIDGGLVYVTDTGGAQTLTITQQCCSLL